MTNLPRTLGLCDLILLTIGSSEFLSGRLVVGNVNPHSQQSVDNIFYGASVIKECRRPQGFHAPES